MSDQPRSPRYRTWLRGLVLLTVLAVGAWLQTAEAQPQPPAGDPPTAQPKAPAPQPKAPAPKAPAPRAPVRPAPDAAMDRPPPGGPPPAGSLPSWHPQVAPPGGSAAPPGRRPTPEQLRGLIQRAQQATGQKPDQAHAAPPDAAPHKPHYPVDEHGHCIGQGNKDRPKDINLFHGWLGVNNEKAEPPPQAKGSMEWWKWRLIPYPWRYENHDDHCDPRNQPIPLLANIVNLGVLVFLIVRFGRKPVAEALKQRKTGIMSEIEKAREIRTGAQNRLDRYEDELEHLDEKLAALREQYALEGAREEKRAVRDAGEARDRMMADAEFRVAQEGKTARDELSRDALEAALKAAERLLSTSVTQADQDRLAEEYLGQIGDALKSDGGEA